MSGPDIALILGGVAGILGGVAAIITAWRTSRKVGEVQEAVGNGGQSVTEMLLTNVNLLTEIRSLAKQLIDLDGYVHKRNHDILDRLTSLQPTVLLLLDVVQELRDELRHLREGQ